MCVSDTGSGMPPKLIAKASDSFFTTKAIGPGAGLYLSMIYGFACQSGGQARIYSEMGQGIMVYLYLPRHIGDEERVEQAFELADAPHAKRGEIVLEEPCPPSILLPVQ